VSQPSAPLNPDQQRELVWRVGQALASMAPPGWRQLRIEYRAAGRHIEADMLVTGPDGLPRPAQPHQEAVRLLGMLRSGMYAPGRGTWLGVIVVFDPVQPPDVDFLRPDVEPPWRQRPPAMGFQDELRFFPRADEHTPGWLRQATGPAPATDGPVRTPRIYDGVDASGRPLVRRAPLAPAERDRVLEYLGAAPVVLAARSHGADAFAPEHTDVVPMNFRTDGSWVWPGAVAYYLREHDVPPDPELVAHIRARRFVVPEVDEPARDLALAAVTGEPA